MPGAAERVNICYAWIQQLLQQRIRMGGLAADAPILSREWQLLSEGLLAFEQCRWDHVREDTMSEMNVAVWCGQKPLAPHPPHSPAEQDTLSSADGANVQLALSGA